ncbi:MAG TPA: hypothetical protein VNS32_22545 [Flavisolibacter sp.]|nr:hypothetical protein [Flavisolibacter sp.]
MHKFFNAIIVLLVTIFHSQGPRDMIGAFQRTYSDTPKLIIPYKKDPNIVVKKDNPAFLRNFAKLMGLVDVMKTKDSFHLRIWQWGDKKKYIIDVVENEGRKEGKIYAFNTVRKDSAEYIIVHNIYENLSPKSGWKKFNEAIRRYGIIDFKSGTIQNQNLGFLTQMSYVQFEISTLGQYR